MYVNVQTLMQVLKLKCNIFVGYVFLKVQCTLVLNALCIFRGPSAMFYGF